MRKQYIRGLSMLVCVAMLFTACGFQVDKMDAIVDELKKRTMANKDLVIMMSGFNTQEVYEWSYYNDNEALDIKYLLSTMMLGNDPPLGLSYAFDNTHAETYDEYVDIRNNELFVPDGPELILIGYGEDYSALVDSGIALDVADKVEGYDKIHDVLKDGYFIPIGMGVKTDIIMTNRLDKLGLTMPETWSKEAYYDLVNAYVEETNPYVLPMVIRRVMNQHFNQRGLFFNQEGKPQLDSDQVLAALYAVKADLVDSGKYRIPDDFDANLYRQLFRIGGNALFSGAKYGNDYAAEVARYYYESVMEAPVLEEYWVSPMLNALNAAYIADNHIQTRQMLDNLDGYQYNEMFGRDEVEDVTADMFTYRPNATMSYTSWGFIVNRHGKNLDKALDFVEYLLRDDVQKGLLNTSVKDSRRVTGRVTGDFPVVNTLDADIQALNDKYDVNGELRLMQAQVLGEILSGDRTRGLFDPVHSNAYSLYPPWPLDKSLELKVKNTLEHLVLDLCFSDKPPTEEEIKRTLTKLQFEVYIAITE